MRDRSRLLLLLTLVSACDGVGDLLDVDDDRLAPSDVTAEYEWIEEGWDRDRSNPIGHPSVSVTWTLPVDWDGEVFRVYSRSAGRGGYRLSATVTSCDQSFCRYSDLNVAPGESYDYFVAAADDRSDREYPSAAVRDVRVPTFVAPAVPTQVSARALDDAVWIRWTSTGAEQYRIFLKREGTSAVFVEVGQTDGTSFLDTRARNGQRYGYQVAAVDTLGHVSTQSALVTATPRPDYHAELIYALSDSAAASGFRFASSGGEDPIVAGTAPSAQWRLESVGPGLRIVPLGQTRVTAGQFTTALTCGPGSDADCESVLAAPEAGRFGTAPVDVEAANTYVFQVVGADGRARYGKVRVQGRTTDSSRRAVAIFDWAYQLLPDETSLDRR